MVHSLSSIQVDAFICFKILTKFNRFSIKKLFHLKLQCEIKFMIELVN